MEFCFRRKRSGRREREYANLDMYRQPHGEHVPRRWDRRDAEPRRVGGGRGHGVGHRAPVGGHFGGRAPYRSQYGNGPRDRGYERFDRPRFGRRGGYQPNRRGQGMSNFSNPTVEQMT